MSFIWTVLLILVLVNMAGAIEKTMPGNTRENFYTSPLPHTYIAMDELPKSFYWGNVNGTSFLTHSLN
jgi:hypothetical protein